MDDSFSIWFLIGYAFLFGLSWVFGRAERFLSLRSVASVQALVDANRLRVPRFLLNSPAKRRVAVSFGIGVLAANLILVAGAFVFLTSVPGLSGAGLVLAYGIAALLAFVPLAVTHFVVPNLKTADDMSGPFLRLAAPLLVAWAVLTFPLSLLLDRILTHLAHQPENREAREEALLALVEGDEVDGVLEADKRDMISSIMSIDETLVREVMVPRVDMVAIERSQSLTDLLELIRETQHSRIPVYDGKLDNIVGIVHAKDVLDAVSSFGGANGGPATAEDAMRESHVLFVPMTKRVDDLLRELRKEKKHMAIVVDEYGGTAGLVTMEDVLEEIVGEIQDEYDEEEQPYKWLDPKKLEVSAGMSIADLAQLLGAEFPEEQGYETVAGFLYHQFGAVPSKGESTRYGPYTFTVTGVDAQRITTVDIEIHGDEARGTEFDDSDA
ncbi:MAG: Magnesium and cobalt efflux protein CorC [Candidatus Latescibacteria bacterium ADurb.Bin168]|nr:MAG: Magnesium and cobalt efflux protein CorC [Candidatus Latescibacteria bacterium ADurb.Bin168]